MPSENVLPPNIQEFNEITAVVLSELYKSHPHTKVLDPVDIAAALGVSPETKMQSGRTFNDMFYHTLMWLADEGFISNHAAIHPYRATLTARTFAGLKNDLGPRLVDASKQSASQDGKVKLAEIAGSFFGSFTAAAVKSIGGAG